MTQTSFPMTATTPTYESIDPPTLTDYAAYTPIQKPELDYDGYFEPIGYEVAP